MGGDPTKRHLGLKLVWLSPQFEREHSTTIWYESATARARGRKTFAAETISGGKPKFIRIEDVQR